MLSGFPLRGLRSLYLMGGCTPRHALAMPLGKFEATERNNVLSDKKVPDDCVADSGSLTNKQWMAFTDQRLP